MTDRVMGGIYIIRHKHSDAFYVGATVDFFNRKRGHWRNIRSGKQGAPYLIALANATGNSPDDFTFSPLIVCAAEHLKMYEDRALDILHGTPGCLNAAGARCVPDAATMERRRLTRLLRGPRYAEYRELKQMREYRRRALHTLLKESR